MALLTFGDFAFEVQDGPETMEETRAYGFGEHALLDTKPVLQNAADALRALSLSVRWSAAMHYPGLYWDTLVTMAEAKEAHPLVWGSGRVEGRFVIVELTRNLLQLAEDGRILAMEARLSLKEYVEREPLVAMERKQKQKTKGKPAVNAKGPGYPTAPPNGVPPSSVTRQPPPPANGGGQ